LTKLVDPDAPVVVEIRDGRRYIPMPSRDAAVQRVHSLTKKLADLPAPPDQSNPIAVALCYELFGLEVEEAALAMGVTVQVLNSIRTTEHYSQFKSSILENIRNRTVDLVTRKFEEKVGDAAQKISDLVDSPSGLIALRASQMVLDGAKANKAEDPMKQGLQIVIYNNVASEQPVTLEHQP
jgi:hypothetical protein